MRPTTTRAPNAAVVPDPRDHERITTVVPSIPTKRNGTLKRVCRTILSELDSVLVRLQPGTGPPVRALTESEARVIAVLLAARPDRERERLHQVQIPRSTYHAVRRIGL